MSEVGPYQAPGARAWFDALPNSDYWATCETLRQRERETDETEPTD